MERERMEGETEQDRARERGRERTRESVERENGERDRAR